MNIRLTATSFENRSGLEILQIHQKWKNWIFHKKIWFKGTCKFGASVVFSGKKEGIITEAIKKPKLHRDDDREKPDDDDSNKLQPHQVMISLDGIIGHQKPKSLNISIDTCEANFTFKAAHESSIQTSLDIPGVDIDSRISFDMNKSRLQSEYMVIIDDIIPAADFSRLTASLSTNSPLDKNVLNTNFTQKICVSAGFSSQKMHPRIKINA